MAKTKEELDKLKQEYEVLVNKLKELNEDEIMLVTGGSKDSNEYQANPSGMRTSGDIYIG